MTAEYPYPPAAGTGAYLTAAELNALLLDAAGQKGRDEGMGFTDIQERLDACWMTCALWQRQLRPVPAGSALRITVTDRTEDSVKSSRVATLYADGQEAACCTFVFMGVDRASRRILRSARTAPLMAPPEARVAHVSLPRLHTPETLTGRGSCTVQPEDCDGNGHMNTAVYLRVWEHCLGPAPVPGEFAVSFARECLPGETLTLFSDGRYSEGRKTDGSVAFRVAVLSES